MERKKPSSSKLPDKQQPSEKNLLDVSPFKSTKEKDSERRVNVEDSSSDESNNAGCSGVSHGHLDSSTTAEDESCGETSEKSERKKSSSLKPSNRQRSSKKKAEEILRQSGSSKRKDSKTKPSEINPARDRDTDEESEYTSSDIWKVKFDKKCDTKMVLKKAGSSSLPTGGNLPPQRKSSTKITKESVHKTDGEDSSSDQLGKAGPSGVQNTSSKQTGEKTVSSVEHDHIHSLKIAKDNSRRKADKTMEKKSSSALKSPKTPSPKKKVDKTSRKSVSDKRKGSKVKSPKIYSVEDLDTYNVENEDTVFDDFKRDLITSDNLSDAEKLLQDAPKSSPSQPSGLSLTKANLSSPIKSSKGRILKNVYYREDTSSGGLSKAGPSGVRHNRLHSGAVSENENWTKKTGKVEKKKSSSLKLSKKKPRSKKMFVPTSPQSASSEVKNLEIRSSSKSKAVKDLNTDVVGNKLKSSSERSILTKNDSNLLKLAKDNDLADTENLKKSAQSSASLPNIRNPTETSKSSPYPYWEQVRAKKGDLKDNASAKNVSKPEIFSSTWKKFQAKFRQREDIEKRKGSMIETDELKNTREKEATDESSEKRERSKLETDKLKNSKEKEDRNESSDEDITDI